jgi:hypothetical protein
MKPLNRILLFCLLLLHAFLAKAQSTTTVLKEKSLIKSQTIYLNSKARIGGKSRVTVPVKLPANTVSWYYSFSTVKTNDASTKLAGSGLEMQIARLIANGAINVIKAGVVTNIAGQLVKPTGSAVVDIYLVGKDGLEQFEKKDLVGMYAVDVPKFYRQGTAQNSRNGVFQIPVIKDNLALCLKNPSVTEGVAISIDVVAIVAVSQYSDVWTPAGTELLYNDCLNKFSIKDSDAEKICDCARTNIKSTYKPAAYAGLSPSEKDNLIRANVKLCAEQAGFSANAYKEKKVNEITQLARGQQITKDYKGAVLSYRQLMDLGLDSPDVYHRLAHNLLFDKQFSEAKKYLTIGLGKSPQDLHLMASLANYYLLTGEINQAMEIYEQNKNKKTESKKRFKDIIAEDLKEFERLGYGNANFTRVRHELHID